MATRLTRNLRLRIEDGLSAASVANLERLDLLGASIYVTTGDDVVIRARENIVLQPSSDDIGGGTDGGNIYLGQSGTPADRIELNSTEIYINGELLPAVSDILTTTDLDGKEDDLGLPSADGQVLKSNTDGNRFWGTLSGLVASQNFAVDWEPADGATFNYSHGLSTETIEVSIYDPAIAQYIAPDSVSFPDNNNVSISVIEAPTTTWKVFIREVLTV